MTQPTYGPMPAMPPTPPPGPNRNNVLAIVIGAVIGGLLLFILGIVIGSVGSTDTATARPRPAITVTVTPKAKPAPTVTVTKTANPKAEAKKEKPKPKETKAPANPDKVTFKVWGNASAGVDTTYGSDTESIAGNGVPMTNTLNIKDDAMYYHISAQLQGGGDIHCSVTVDGKTKEGHAVGGYNICSAQLNSGVFGGWS